MTQTPWRLLMAKYAAPMNGSEKMHQTNRSGSRENSARSERLGVPTITAASSTTSTPMSIPKTTEVLATVGGQFLTRFEEFRGLAQDPWSLVLPNCCQWLLEIMAM